MTLNDLDEHSGYNCLDFETCSYKSDRTTKEKTKLVIDHRCMRSFAHEAD